MQRTTRKRQAKHRKSPPSTKNEECSQNSFVSALAAVCGELEKSGDCTGSLPTLYRLFWIRAQLDVSRGGGCSPEILEEVVQDCMMNFWNGLRRPGKMRTNLQSLTGSNLKAYMAGTVRLLVRRQTGILMKKEVRQRGYSTPPAIMTKKLDGETCENWWDELTTALGAGQGSKVSPMDLEKIMAVVTGGFDQKVLEAAAEFFEAAGHTEFAEHLLSAANAQQEKSKRTAQRRKLENKQKLREELGG